jgi:hypothetical protein
MRNGNKHRFKLVSEAAAMGSYDFSSMSTAELWTLHEKITSTLAAKLAAERTRLEKRLRQLKQGGGSKCNNVTPCSPTLSAGFSEIQKSCATIRDMGWSREAAPLVISTIKIWKKTRRFQNPIVKPRSSARTIGSPANDKMALNAPYTPEKAPENDLPRS